MAVSILRLAKLLIFYTIFYSILGAFFALCYKLFLTTLNDHKPKWILDESLIGTNPGMTFKPSFGSVIHYRQNTTYSQDWIQQLHLFLQPYLSVKKSANIEDCRHSKDPKKVCDYKILSSEFLPCIPQYNYGFDDGQPCIFLKLNKIFGWVPEFYHTDNVPENMPNEILELIKRAEEKNMQDKVWVDCRPLDPSDENNIGEIKYYPQQGFEGKYFPYNNVEGYLSPLVAVHFKNPKRGVLFNVECRAWAVNIEHDRKYNKGLARFSFIVH